MAEESRQEINPPSQQCPESLPKVAERKTEWPELVRLTAEEAAKIIKEEKEGVVIQVVTPGIFVTMDYRTDRVRIFVDASGVVERVPTVG